VQNLEWLNLALAHIWPDMEQTLQTIVESQVIPKLEEKLPKDKIQEVRISRFTLGKTSPEIGPIQVTNLAHGVSRMRCIFEYLSDMVVEFSIATSVATISCGISNLQMSGAIVLRIDSYIENSPGTAGPTGGVSGYFLDKPEIDFQFTGHASILDSIGIRGIIRNAIQKAVCAKMVTPNILTQLIGLSDLKIYPLAFQSPPPVGILRVTLQSAQISVVQKSEEDNDKKVGKKRSSFSKLKETLSIAGEWIDNRVGHIAGVDTDPYLQLEVGDQMWTPTVKALGSTLDFTVFDPEQRLTMSVWDRDVTSEDDMLGKVGSYSIADAVAASEKSLKVHGAEGEFYGTVQLKFSWLLATPGVLSPGGCVVLISLHELRQEGDAMKGKHLAVRTRLKGEEQTTLPGQRLKGGHESELVVKALAKVRENLMEAKVDESTIDQALALKGELTRLAINTSFHFTVSPKDLESEVLELSLIEIGRLPNINSNNKCAVEAVASEAFQLSALKSKANFYEPGPVIFETPFGKVYAGITLSLAGLTVPGQSQVPVYDGG
jgi:hypothetical protein